MVLIVLLLLFSLTPLGCKKAKSEPLAVGDQAPFFTLVSADGSTFSLADMTGKKAVLLYFHMAYG